MDGPNVNWKFVDMLSKQLLDEGNSSFLNIGSCGLHIIYGAFKHGSNSTSWELERFLSSIFKLFKDPCTTGRLHQSHWFFHICLEILQTSVGGECACSRKSNSAVATFALLCPKYTRKKVA